MIKKVVAKLTLKLLLKNILYLTQKIYRLI